MSDKPQTDGAAAGAAPKSKKMLVIALALLVVALAAGGGWVYVMKRNAAMALDGEEVVEEEAHEVHKEPPVYLPLDNMVVNLADPGGERVAQVGVVLQLADANAPEQVKAYLPTIRSEILLLVSQRTADELLLREGKEKLAQDILGSAAHHFPGEVASAKKKTGKKKSKAPANPIQGVLFSSFIVQ